MPMSWDDYFVACESGDLNQVFDSMIGIGVRPVPITLDEKTQKIKIPFGKGWGNASIEERKRKLNDKIVQRQPIGLGCQADGYVILDIDSPDKDVKHLPTAWKEAATLLLGGEDWPHTLIVKTQGGCHVWFETTEQIKALWGTKGKLEMPLPSGGQVEFFTGNQSQMQVACPPSHGKQIATRNKPSPMPKSVEQAIIDLIQPPEKELPPKPTQTERLRSDSENEEWFLDRLFTLTANTLNAPVNTRHATYRKSVRAMAGYAAGLNLTHLSHQVWIQLSTAHKEAKPEVSDYVLQKTFEWAWEKGISTPLYAPALSLKHSASQGDIAKNEPYFEEMVDPDLEAANVAHILARMKERKWLWGNAEQNLGWIVERGLHLVEGKEGTGKTRWLLDLCRRWSLDLHWPDGVKTEVDPNAKILFVASDSHWDQIATTTEAFGIPFENIIFTGTEDDPYNYTNIDDPQTLAMIRHWCRKYKIGLVVIDTLMAASARPLVDPQEVAKIATPLREIAREFAVPVVLVGHLNKDGETWGRAMGRTCDNVIRLEADERDPQAISIKSVKARWNRFELPAITGRQGESGWEYEVTHKGTVMASSTPYDLAIQKVIKIFTEYPSLELTKKSLKDEMVESGVAESTAYRYIDKMIIDETLVSYEIERGSSRFPVYVLGKKHS